MSRLPGCAHFFSLSVLIGAALACIPNGQGVAQVPFADAGGNMTLALAGDAIITRKLSVYEEPEFLRLRESDCRERRPPS